MNLSVAAALAPVALLIAIGVLAGRRGWIGAAATRDLSNLVFFLLSPALLFRAMGSVDAGQLSLLPIAAYFFSAGLIFFGTLLLRGFNPRAAVLAMSSTYGNAVMIGIPLVNIAFGRAGLVTLLMLISVHALVLLTSATVVIELALARQQQAEADDPDRPRRHVAATVASAMRGALLHPVPLPILAGLLFAQTGWTLPEPLDKVLQLLAQAFTPIALILVGTMLAHTRIGTHLKTALLLALVKTLLMPLCVFALGRLLGVAPLALSVMVTAAALPSGANVFLFAQRYQVAQELSTAAVAVSTALSLLTITLVLELLRRL